MAQYKRLPIGIQTFRDIRDPAQNLAYVDKTDIAFRAIDDAKYYFLSRPRRFGKSLFLDTLSEIFKGSKQLFEGLYIYDKWNWDECFPVIRIDFAVGGFADTTAIQKIIVHNLKDNAEKLDVPIENYDLSTLGVHFINLVKSVYQKYNKKVVVLIDEYDKPILDNVVNEVIASEARQLLRDFYSVIKASDQYLRFVFITGVSKFSKLNLFSGLNNIEDITIDKRFATITGYTHHDLLTVFGDYFEGVNMDEVKLWYNGYNYFGEPVYNPFDILLFLSKGKEFSNYWWETGNPDFLIKKLKERPHSIPKLENIVLTKETLNSFDIERIELAALLWQTGYLTFESKEIKANKTRYRMKVPNLEVQDSLNSLFLDYLIGFYEDRETQQLAVADAILDCDMPALEKHIKSLFSAIAHNNYTNNPIAQYEGFYASVIFTFFSSLGFQVLAEDPTNLGRIDMTLIDSHNIFIFEFKVDMPTEAALQQIKTKRYYEKYNDQGKTIYLIGIHFDSSERNITVFESEILNV